MPSPWPVMYAALFAFRGALSHRIPSSIHVSPLLLARYSLSSSRHVLPLLRSLREDHVRLGHTHEAQLRLYRRSRSVEGEGSGGGPLPRSLRSEGWHDPGAGYVPPRRRRCAGRRRVSLPPGCSFALQGVSDRLEGPISARPKCASTVSKNCTGAKREPSPLC